MSAVFLTICGAFAAQDPLSPQELEFIGSPNEVKAHRARMITSERLQKHLHMTDDQRANCAVLKHKIEEDARKPDSRKASEGRAWIQDGAFFLTFDENDKGVADLLDAKQIKRLGQIQLRAFDKWAIFRLNCVAKHLDIDDRQRLEAERLEKRLSAELSELFKTTPIAKVAEVTSKHTIDNQHKHVEILSPAQLEKLDQLLGDSNDGGWLSDFLPKTDVGPKHTLQSTIDGFMHPFRFLFVDELLAHLEVSPKQREKLVEWVVEERTLMAERLKEGGWGWDETGSLTKERLKQRNDDVVRHWRTVQGVLDDKQVKRWKEVFRQARNYDDVYSGSETAAILRVTSAQRKEFNDFHKENVRADREVLRSKMAAILSPEQRKKWEELKGEPLSPDMLRRIRRGFGGPDDEFGIPLVGIGAPP